MHSTPAAPRPPRKHFYHDTYTRKHVYHDTFTRLKGHHKINAQLATTLTPTSMMAAVGVECIYIYIYIHTGIHMAFII